jgi:hypothetical protein
MRSYARVSSTRLFVVLNTSRQNAAHLYFYQLKHKRGVVHNAILDLPKVEHAILHNKDATMDSSTRK